MRLPVITTQMERGWRDADFMQEIPSPSVRLTHANVFLTFRIVLVLWTMYGGIKAFPTSRTEYMAVIYRQPQCVKKRN